MYLKKLHCFKFTRCHRRTYSTQDTTHFGFKTVQKEAKEQLVGDVFHKVAHKYDVMNDAMSGGTHRLWKDHFMSKLHPIPGMKLLDVAGGTGDIAFRFLHHIKKSPLYSPTNRSKVTVVDINASMLEVGKQRALELGYDLTPNSETSIEFKLGNAESLPIDSSSVDAYTIAFGIRNCTNIDKVVSEAYRVLIPGGRFMCLEFSRVENPIISTLYDQFSFNIIPVLGDLIAGDRDSYVYLVESIRKFPDQESFAKIIGSVGFEGIEFENLFNGIAAIHSGFKPIRKKESSGTGQHII